MLHIVTFATYRSEQQLLEDLDELMVVKAKITDDYDLKKKVWRTKNILEWRNCMIKYKPWQTEIDVTEYGVWLAMHIDVRKESLNIRNRRRIYETVCRELKIYQHKHHNTCDTHRVPSYYNLGDKSWMRKGRDCVDHKRKISVVSSKTSHDSLLIKV